LPWQEEDLEVEDQGLDQGQGLGLDLEVHLKGLVPSQLLL
jgi:hypothetical protein